MERVRYWVDDSVTALKLQGKSRLFPNPPSFYTEHKQERMPTVLIPGLLERWGLLRKIGTSISRSRDGHDVYIVPELGNNQFDIKTSAEIVEKVIDLNGLHNVILISHSKGGLIGKQILIDGLAEKMIAIATPFSGSDMAGYFPFDSFQELIPQSPMIQKLMENNEVNNRIVSIYPKLDNLIPNGCYLEGAENHPVSVKGHHKVLNDRRVIMFIKDKLQIWEEENK
jgi:pimeloyl-ACP methyl ester carboxylesterase